MDLDGKRLAREQQLEQERGIQAGLSGRSYQISPIGAASWAALLQGQIDDAPRPRQRLRARTFDRHEAPRCEVKLRKIGEW